MDKFGIERLYGYMSLRLKQDGIEEFAPGIWNEIGFPNQWTATWESYNKNSVFFESDGTAEVIFEYRYISTYTFWCGIVPIPAWNGTYNCKLASANASIVGYQQGAGSDVSVPEDKEDNPENLIAYISPDITPPPPDKLIRIESSGFGAAVESGKLYINVSGAKHRLWEKVGNNYSSASAPFELTVEPDESASKALYIQPLETGIITATARYEGEGLSESDSVKMKIEECPSCNGGTCVPGSGSGKVESVHYITSYGSTAMYGFNGKSSFVVENSSVGKLASTSNIRVSVRPGDGNEIVNDANGNLKQVKVANILEVIEQVNDYKVLKKFYNSSQIGLKDDSTGEYPVSGNPFRVVTIEDTTQSDNTMNITITNELTLDGKTSKTVTIFERDASTYAWGMLSADENGNVLKREELVPGAIDSGNGVRTEYKVYKDGSGNIAYKTKTVKKLFQWAEEVTQEVVDPDGKALTTEYQYYDQGTDGGNYGKLKAVINYDGSWTRYVYDSQGREWKTIRPFNNSLITDAENLCAVSETTYDTENKITCSVEKVLGVEVSRSYGQDVDTGVSKDVQCTVAGAAFDNAANLVTTTWKYTSGSFAGKLWKISNPDGQMSFYSYDTDTNGNLVTTVERGVPNGTGSAIADGTRTVSLTNAYGSTIETKSYDILTGLIIGWSNSGAVDSFGRSIYVQNMDGTRTETIYGCCGPTQTTDKEGTVTTYGYDALKRLSFTANAGITTFYTYDAMDRTISTTVKGSDGSELTTSTVYDATGEVVSDTDAAGRITTYSEAIVDGLRVRTTTNPDGNTVIEKYNRDGQLAERSGTAVHHQKYEYGVEDGKLFTKAIIIGDGGSETQWVKSLRGFTSSSTKTVYPDGSHEETFYDSLGRPVKNVGSTGITVLTGYNAKGEVQYSAVDMNRDGVIDLSGPDIVTSYENSYVLIPNKIYHRSATSMYMADGNETPTLVSENLSSVDGLENKSASFGRTTTSITSYPEGGGRVVTVTNPDSSTITSSYTAGLLQSATHSVLGTTSYAYDAFNRMKSVTNTVNGSSRTNSYTFDNSGNIASVTDAAGRKTSFTYDLMGRRTATNLPGGRKVNYSYYPTGELKQQYGSDTYPQSYTYDATGRMKTLMTYKSFSPYLPAQGQAVTTWNYEPQRGFLSSKIYDDGKSVSYTYNYDGSLATRVWARGITTTYGYDNAGALSGVTYSNSTPSVSYTRDRLGRPVSITDAAGSHTQTYNADGSLASEGTVGYTYDALGRRISMSATGTPTTNYTYDAMSRLATVSDGARTATYNRVPGSSLLASTVINNGTSDILTASRTYDILDRLTNITSNGISYNYTYDNSDKRTKNVLSDGSYWIYEYDDLGQVTKGKKYTSTGIEVVGQSFGYNYDNIGNLKTENRNGNVFKYSSNNVNQYTQRTVPGRVNISGSADASAKVTIKQASAGYTKPLRYGNYFNSFFTLDNSTNAVTDSFDIYAVKFDGTKDKVAKQSLDIFVPKTPEQFTYDNDGNLLTDGRFTYTWNGENRLIKAEYSDTRIEFTYDYMGRRTNKKLYINNVLSSELKFIYDGWNLVAEYDGSNTLLNSYLWGEDLSGSLQGAGGVGGLLAVNNYLTIYDGNGNVMNYIDAADGTTKAEFEYRPDGTFSIKIDPLNLAETASFSTKPYDPILDATIYQLRILKNGRWLSRDPIGEISSRNVYNFINNASITYWDYLGMTSSGETVNVPIPMPQNGESTDEFIKRLAKEAFDDPTPVPDHLPPENILPPGRIPVWEKDEPESQCDKCNKWRLETELVIYAAGFIANIVTGHTRLYADRTQCPNMSDYSRAYRFTGLAGGVALKIPGSVSVTTTSRTIETDMLTWEDFHGWGRITSAGIGMGYTYGLLYVTFPVFGTLNFHGWGSGIDASAITGGVYWFTQKD
ncbi:MAG: hypothetical protein A2020_11095 [Lentisphaerae bacterium GWF2_45_14]|nr:MAG: hypothetical protein A2020_11095 [Lentisphaerae bacterium GWF2_45_14]